MQPLQVSGAQVRTGWSGALSRVVAALFLFEIISGLAITFGSFHPAIEWGLLLHTMMGLVMVAPLALYLIWHWSDYTDQGKRHLKAVVTDFV
jgi:nicotinamide riboside transporter PnuC